MIINILCQGFQMTKDEQAHAERQLDVAVGRGLPHVTSVVITISDANSLRGRFDNRYCIIAWIEGLEDLFVEEEDANLQALIDRITERLRRLVGRRSEPRVIHHNSSRTAECDLCSDRTRQQEVIVAV